MPPTDTTADQTCDHEAPRASARRPFEVLMNAGSGADAKRETRAHVDELLRARGVPAQVTLLPGDALARAARTCVREGRVPVAAGGDGTVATVAAAVAGSGREMGVLPLGTFNYFARGLGLPLALDEAVAALCDGAVRTTSVGYVNGRVFLNNASIGIYPSVLHERESVYRRFGRGRAIAYAVTLRLALRRWRRLQLSMTIDGRDEARATELLFVAGNRYQLEELGLHEEVGCLASGRFSIHTTRALGRLALVKLSARALLGKLEDASEVVSRCGSEIDVRLPRRRVRVAIDGEVFVARPPLRFRLRRDALRVIGPPDGA